MQQQSNPPTSEGQPSGPVDERQDFNADFTPDMLPAGTPIVTRVSDDIREHLSPTARANFDAAINELRTLLDSQKPEGTRITALRIRISEGRDENGHPLGTTADMRIQGTASYIT